jgi:hypothetical protein
MEAFAHDVTGCCSPDSIQLMFGQTGGERVHESHDRSEARVRPHSGRPLWSVPLQTKVHPLVWAALAIAIFCLDFLTGPYVQVAILFVFPVALATWSHGRLWGSVIAVALPLLRLPFFYFMWETPSSWALRAIDAAVDLVVLLALVQVIAYIRRQRREIHVLEGMLPICGFCKRIRDENGGWLQLERYIAERSEAQFTHTFCPDCGRAHYGSLME